MEEAPIVIKGGPLKPHEYFLVKPRRTAGDMRYINNQAMTMQKGGESNMRLGDWQFATVVRMLRGWNITLTQKNPDGTTFEEPMVFDPGKPEQCIEELSDDYFLWLYNEIEERKSGMSEEAQKNSQSAPTNGSSENQKALQNQS